jgi:hypothetical protein
MPDEIAIDDGGEIESYKFASEDGISEISEEIAKDSKKLIITSPTPPKTTTKTSVKPKVEESQKSTPKGFHQEFTINDHGKEEEIDVIACLNYSLKKSWRMMWMR